VSFGTYKMAPRHLSLEKGDLKRLIDFIIQQTRESREAHRKELNLANESDESKAAIHNMLEEAYRVAVFVYGADGEELIVYDSNIIDAPEFPDRLTRLTIDTFIPYRNRISGSSPRNAVRVDLDFSSSGILDWQSNVSGPTPNFSEVLIQGIDDNWRSAMLSFLQKLFRKRANFRGFLHAPFTYDLYLWLIFIPIYFYGMIVFEERIDKLLGNAPIALKAAIYLYAFVVFANLYRILIGYVRWTFQSIELKNVPSTQHKHRRFWAFLATAILIPLLLRLASPK